MKNILCIILSAIIIFSSCNHKPGTDAENNNDAQKEYYPISNFITAQTKLLDSLPLAVIKYTTTGTNTDTAVVDKRDFAAIAAYFATPDITAPGIKDQFDESSFIDASIGTISLTYTAKNDTISLQKADVLLKQENSRVSTVYIEKKDAATNGTMIKKMLWTANKNMQVTTIEQLKGAPEKITIEKYVWDE